MILGELNIGSREISELDTSTCVTRYQRMPISESFYGIIKNTLEIACELNLPIFIVPWIRPPGYEKYSAARWYYGRSRHLTKEEIQQFSENPELLFELTKELAST